MMHKKHRPTTESEKLFDTYLESNGYLRREFEPSIPGGSQRPDFVVHWNSHKLLFEVKERQGNESVASGSPYERIRQEIHKARRKFTDFKEYCCSLVIYNAGDRHTSLLPQFVFAAMLGDGAFSIPVNLQDGTIERDEVASIFLPRGGKMIRSYRTGHYENTTISSVIILKTTSVPTEALSAAFDEELLKRREAVERALTAEEKAAAWVYAGASSIAGAGDSPKFRRIPRVLICEHPCPRIALPEDVFKGDFDERYTVVKGEVRRTFCGRRVCDDKIDLR